MTKAEVKQLKAELKEAILLGRFASDRSPVYGRASLQCLITAPGFGVKVAAVEAGNARGWNYIYYVTVAKEIDSPYAGSTSVGGLTTTSQFITWAARFIQQQLAA